MLDYLLKKPVSAPPRFTEVMVGTGQYYLGFIQKVKHSLHCLRNMC